MPALPKPQHCGQDWLAMSPTKNGRLCGQCDKIIHDFSRLSWAEIERQQQAHGNALCGMYSPAQLTHWGQEVPGSPGACARLTAATTLALTLSSLPILAQTDPAKTSGSIVVRGTVHDNSKKSRPEPLPGVTVLLKGTQIGVSSNADGTYELSIPNTVVARHAMIAVSSVGYFQNEFALDSLGSGSPDVVVHNVELKPVPSTGNIFYVRRATLARRAWWTVKGWFRRDE